MAGLFGDDPDLLLYQQGDSVAIRTSPSGSAGPMGTTLTFGGDIQIDPTALGVDPHKFPGQRFHLMNECFLLGGGYKNQLPIPRGCLDDRLDR